MVTRGAREMNGMFADRPGNALGMANNAPAVLAKAAMMKN
jgi:hypothetical protein